MHHATRYAARCRFGGWGQKIGRRLGIIAAQFGACNATRHPGMQHCQVRSQHVFRECSQTALPERNPSRQSPRQSFVFGDHDKQTHRSSHQLMVVCSRDPPTSGGGDEGILEVSAVQSRESGLPLVAQRRILLVSANWQFHSPFLHLTPALDR